MSSEANYREIQALREQLREAQDTLNAIHNREVNAAGVLTAKGLEINTLTGAERPYRLLIEKMSEGAVILADNNEILYCNQGFASIVHIPLKKLIGDNIENIVSPNHLEKLKELLFACRATHNTLSKEISFQTDIAQTVPVYVSVNYFGPSNASWTFVIIKELSKHTKETLESYAHNLEREKSKREKVEEELKRSNQKIKEILSSIQDDFYVLDRNWNFVYVNYKFLSKIGKKPKDLIGNNIWKIFPKYLGTVFEENCRAAMEKREIRRFEVTGEYANSWYRMTAFPSSEGITVLGIDITEQKKTEEKLTLIKNKYRSLVEPNFIGIVSADSEHILEANDAFLNIVGYSRADLENGNMHWQKMTPLEYEALDSHALKEIEEHGKCKPFEKEYCRKDGSRVQVLIGAALLQPEPFQYVCFVEDITERKKVEEALAITNQKKYDVLFNTITEGLARYKTIPNDSGIINDLFILDINPAGAMLTGLKQEELIGKTFRQLWMGIPYSLIDAFQEVDKTGRPKTFEEFNPLMMKWFINKIEKTSNDEYVIISFDVTDRKRIEDDLHKSRLLLSNIINSSDSRISAFDKEEKLILLNDAESSFLKISKAQALGKTPIDLSGKNISQNSIKQDKMILGTGTSLRFEETAVTKGELRTFLTNKFPLRNEKGDTYGVGAVRTDVTDIKKTEESLRQSEEYFHAVFDNTALGIVIMNLEEKVLHSNPSYQYFTGYSQEELASHSFFTLSSLQDTKIERSLIQELLKQQKDHYDIERRFICKDGNVRWGHVTGSIILDAKGEPSMLIATVEDITQRKLVERQLERYRNNLEQLVYERTKQLKCLERSAIVGQTAGLVGQQLLLKYIFQANDT